MKNCTLVVTSCDKYEDAWYPFFFFLKEQWLDFKMPIILNTETKSFSFPGLDIQTFSFYKAGEQVPWSQRLLDHLDKVETDYILLMCEDYFLRSPVDEKRLDQLITWMEEDKSISTFGLIPSPLEVVDDHRFKEFLLRTQTGAYRFQTSGLWRVSHLKMYLKPDESPWDFEIIGNYRSFFTENKFYIVKPEVQLFIDYGFSFDWMGICRGKWVINDVQPLFYKYGLKVDFSRLGTIEMPRTNKVLTRFRPSYRKRLSAWLRFFSKKSRRKRKEHQQKVEAARQYVEELKKQGKWY